MAPTHPDGLPKEQGVKRPKYRHNFSRVDRWTRKCRHDFSKVDRWAKNCRHFCSKVDRWKKYCRNIFSKVDRWTKKYRHNFSKVDTQKNDWILDIFLKLLDGHKLSTLIWISRQTDTKSVYIIFNMETDGHRNCLH